MENGRLVKIDRNGSKHYEGMVRCDRCGGTGVYIHHIENGIPSPNWTDNGVCHKCLGEGKVFGKWIVRTPEYEAKLAARRQANAEAKKAEHDAQIEQIRKEWLTKHGWDAEGFTFLFTGNTFEIKDTIKDLGGKFDEVLGWHIDHKVEGFELLKVTTEVLDPTYWGYTINIDRTTADQMKREFLNTLHPTEHTSTYVGEIGDRLKNLHLTLTFQTTSEHQEPQKYRGWFTVTTFIYSFKDEQGNIFTYFTSSPLETIDKDGRCNPIEKGQTYTISGTVKEHKEYKGDKQTVLQRCKLSA